MTTKKTTSITPFLTVPDGREAVKFYVSAFDAVEVKRFDMPDDKISSVIEIGNARFFVGDEEVHNGNVSPVPGAAHSVRIVLETSDADRLYSQAISAGAVSVCPMTTEDDWRIGKLKDPSGHLWELGYTL